MGRFWVKTIRPIIRYDLSGAYRRYMPGDWFECRNQERAELVRGGFIEGHLAGISVNFTDLDAGVLALGQPVPPETFNRYGIKLQYGDTIELPWERTLLWHTRTPMTPEGAALGLMRIDAENQDSAWEMAAMLKGETLLARDVGTELEQERTLEALGDLRLPVYETGILWVRRTETTEEVIRLWQSEVADGADAQHAFIRTIYTLPVILCTLPAKWVGQWMRG
jgi:hypothetical protein